jgi:hypothetical protein
LKNKKIRILLLFFCGSVVPDTLNTAKPIKWNTSLADCSQPSFVRQPLEDYTRCRRKNSNNACLAVTGWRCILFYRFRCISVYGQPLNHESKTENFWFLEVLAGVTRLIWSLHPWS